ncbi:uncharacterized protein GGS25DRAFT_489655, partial [Hypoxylon fragiforme]|uniref:uncharacterized protein n=1 Tax=Hypoxylon fragiforme TaxID=63214 RepID=UPI0020C6E9EF
MSNTKDDKDPIGTVVYMGHPGHTGYTRCTDYTSSAPNHTASTSAAEPTCTPSLLDQVSTTTYTSASSDPTRLDTPSHTLDFPSYMASTNTPGLASTPSYLGSASTATLAADRAPGLAEPLTTTEVPRISSSSYSPTNTDMSHILITPKPPSATKSKKEKEEEEEERKKCCPYCVVYRPPTGPLFGVCPVCYHWAFGDGDPYVLQSECLDKFPDFAKELD